MQTSIKRGKTLAAVDPVDQVAMVAVDVKVEQQQDWDGKHPLTNTWVFWYSDRAISTEWKNCIKEIGPFGTVEDFWCFFNFLKPVSQLKPGCDLYLFKKGIQPMWEDEANKRGGRWDINIERGTPKEQVDAYWMELAMAMVGEGFSDLGGIVTGACVTKRDKNSRISVWTSVANDQEKLINLGREVKQFLGIEIRIFFRPHEDSAKPSRHLPPLTV